MAETLDDETTAALTLFNEYVFADRDRTRREKRLRKAERAKDEAAAEVKKLSDRGSAEEKAEAEASYREALEKWKALRDGKEPEPTTSPPPAESEAPDEPAATTDEPAEPEATTDEPDATTAEEE